jgi:hypothetical protein
MNITTRVIDRPLTDLVDAAHRASVTTPLPELTGRLAALLGQTLTAFIESPSRQISLSLDTGRSRDIPPYVVPYS